MNVAMMCKQVPAYLPHELLGFSPDSLMGTMLSVELLTKLNILETEASKKHNEERSGRRNKFENNK